MGTEAEPQSVEEAGAALAAVGFDADALAAGAPPVEKEPIVSPATIAERQQATWIGAPVSPATPPAGGTGAVTPTPDAGTTDPFDKYAYTDINGRQVSGRDAVEEAAAIRHGLTTESGVRLIVAQGLTALGKDPEHVRAFMEGRLTEQQVLQTPGIAPAVIPQAPASPWDALGEDDLIDGEQFKAYAAEVQRQALSAAREEIMRAQQPLQTAVEAEQKVRAGHVTDSTLTELLGEDGDPNSVDKDLARKVLTEAAKYVQDNNWDSSHIRAAIIQGHHDVVKIAEAAQRAYLGKKSLVAAGVPQTTGGAQAAGSEEPPEPKSVAEASKLAREMGLIV
jgi:hypothetical protein